MNTFGEALIETTYRVESKRYNQGGRNGNTNSWSARCGRLVGGDASREHEAILTAHRQAFYNGGKSVRTPLCEQGMPMGKAEVIALSEIRASSQWQRLRADLHERFDQWLDRLQAQLPDPQVLLAEVTKTVWTLRQDLTGSICEADCRTRPCG